MAATAWERQQQDNWLRLLRSGDHQAFAEFVDKYKETVFLCCRKLGLAEHEIEDVAGETFLAAYKGLSRYGGRAEHVAVGYSVPSGGQFPAEEPPGPAASGRAGWADCR